MTSRMLDRLIAVMPFGRARRRCPGHQVHRRATVSPDARLLGTGSTIHDGARIRASTAGPHLRLFGATRIDRCSLGSYVSINYRCYVGDATIGSYTYVADDCQISHADIGSYCSIGPQLLVGLGQHPTGWISTSPVFFSPAKQCGTSFAGQSHFQERARVTIGNDVWIGARAYVRDGVTIGDGAVIGAGAVVTRDVPPYAIAAGIPASVRRLRFPQQDVDRLLELRWWDWDPERVERHAALFRPARRRHLPGRRQRLTPCPDHPRASGHTKFFYQATVRHPMTRRRRSCATPPRPAAPVRRTKERDGMIVAIDTTTAPSGDVAQGTLDAIALLAQPCSPRRRAGAARPGGTPPVVAPTQRTGWRRSSRWSRLRRASGRRPTHRRRKLALLADHRVDLLHVAGGGPLDVLAVSLPVVLSVDGLAHRTSPGRFTAPQRWHCETWWTASAFRADAMIVPDDAVRNDLQKQLGVDPAKLFVARADGLLAGLAAAYGRATRATPSRKAA